MPPLNKRPRATAYLGMVALFVSIVLWLAVLAIPFLEFSNKWLVASGLYGLSYVFWFVAIGMLGTAAVKKAWVKFKSLFMVKNDSDKHNQVDEKNNTES